MIPGPKAAADHVVSEFQLTRPPIDAVLLIREIGDTLLWFTDMSQAEIDGKCDEWTSKFLAYLKREHSIRTTARRFTRFAFNSSTATFIQGWCFPEPSDSEQLVAAKLLRANHGKYADIINKVTDRKFEAICAGVLELLGCVKPTLTQRSGDQGIDFFGELNLEGKLGAPFAWPSVDGNFTMWLIGQAKQYSGKVSTKELRELAGSIELARANVGADDGAALSNLRIRLFDPIFYLFLTAGELTADSRKLAQKSGIIALEGGDIAALLADRAVGVVDGSVNEAAVMVWIDSHGS